MSARSGWARRLVHERGGRVTLFHVIPRISGIAPGEFTAFYQRLVERSERKLRQIAQKFAQGGVDVGTAVRVGEPAAEIVRATLRERVDLVVMGSHKVRPGGRRAGGHHKLQGGDLLPVPDPPCRVKPTTTRQRSPTGPTWQTDALVLVEAAD